MYILYIMHGICIILIYAKEHVSFPICISHTHISLVCSLVCSTWKDAIYTIFYVFEMMMAN